MRNIRATILLVTLALFAQPAFSQTVETLELSGATTIDGLYVDTDGVLYGAGGYEKTEMYTVSPTGDVTVFASGLVGPILTVKLPNGEMYVTNFIGNTVTKIDVNGESSKFADVKPGPGGIVADGDGNLYVAHFGTGNGNGNSISKITPDGVVSDFVTGGTLNVPVGMTMDDEGNIYAANIYDGRITRITPTGEQSLYGSLPSTGSLTIGHLLWLNGKLYATHIARHQVYVFENGASSIYAGSGQRGRDDGSATSATFTNPNGIAASVTGDTLYVAEAFGAQTKIRMIIAEDVGTDIGEELPEMPASLQLKANYPNPFNGETQIQFSIARSEQVLLEIFDVLGRKVDTLVDQILPAGDHGIAWRPKDVLRGVYFYRVQTNSEAQMSSMVLQ